MSGTGAPTVLLSSVIQPFGSKYGDGFGVSYEGTHQIMWAQGIFRPRAATTQWGIDFIAENLEASTVTLHYPTLANFITELKKGPKFVGIAFVATTLHKMVPMVKAIRRYAPQAKIVLGGYGTTMEDQQLPKVDHICRGEGVAFMRELLGEPLDAPIRQPVIIQDNHVFSVPIGRVGYVFAGLGCPNGCDFCVTSAYFKRRHVRLLPDGEAIVHAIKRLYRAHPDISSFWISDEDFLLNKKRGRSFLEAVRRSDLPPLSLSIFASVKALSNFTAAELVEMGIDWVWIGYEGQRSGFSKMKGRSYEDVFADLHAHGISILSSMIIGFDYQNEDIVNQEFADLMKLRPSMSQFLIYGPAYGTPLIERMRKEGRLIETADDPRRQDGFNLMFDHPHLDPPEMQALQKRLFHREYTTLGPAIYRVVEDWLSGYMTLRDHPVKRVRDKAERLKNDAHRAMMLIPGALRHVNPKTRAWLEDLIVRLERETGPMTPRERLAAAAIPALMKLEAFKVRFDIAQQPNFTRKSFRMPPQRKRDRARQAFRRVAWA